MSTQPGKYWVWGNLVLSVLVFPACFGGGGGGSTAGAHLEPPSNPPGSPPGGGSAGFVLVPSTANFTINWEQFPEFESPYSTAVWEGPHFNQNNLFALSRGFSHITFNGSTAQVRQLVPPQSRAAMMYSIATTIPGQPWGDIHSPWDNDLAGMAESWTDHLRWLATLYPDSNGQAVPNVDILYTDVEASLPTQYITTIRNHPRVPSEIRSLSTEQFVERYQRDMAELFLQPHQLIWDLGYRGRLGSYGETPFAPIFRGSTNAYSWEQLTSDWSFLTYLLKDYTHGDSSWLQRFGPCYDLFTDNAPSAYLTSNYPATYETNPTRWGWAGSYLAHQLLNVELNKAWSDKPLVLFVSMQLGTPVSSSDHGQHLHLPEVAQALAIFPKLSGADGIWLWSNYGSWDIVGDPGLNYSIYEHFIYGLYRLSRYNSMFQGNYESYVETNARDTYRSGAPVWRGIVNHDQNKMLVGVCNPYAAPGQRTVVPIHYQGTLLGNVELTGMETVLQVFDLP